MATLIIPFLVMIIGALIYAFATNGKHAEIGRLMFFSGLFWCVYAVSGRTIRIL